MSEFCNDSIAECYSYVNVCFAWLQSHLLRVQCFPQKCILEGDGLAITRLSQAVSMFSVRKGPHMYSTENNL